MKNIAIKNIYPAVRDDIADLNQFVRCYRNSDVGSIFNFLIITGDNIDIALKDSAAFVIDPN